MCKEHMKQKIITPLLVLGTAVVLAGCTLGQQNRNGQSTSPKRTSVSSNSVTTSSPPAADEATSFTLSEVATHNSASDCWMAVDGNVYDVTAYVDAHPGGQAEILKGCGLDATAMFQAERHHGSPKTQAALLEYEIGTLTE